jgi:hypothetical protein
MPDDALLAARDEVDALRAVLASHIDHIDRLERRIASGTVRDGRYSVRTHRGFMYLHCADCGTDPRSLPEGARYRGVLQPAAFDTELARHERAHHRGGPPQRMPARDLVEALGVLEGCVAVPIGFPVRGVL